MKSVVINKEDLRYNIEKIKEYVPQAIKEVSDLVIIKDENNVPVGFMGIEEQKLEMLFIKNS